MIDKQGRRIASDLVRNFSAGEISNEEFETQWPIGSKDAGLSAIARQLWSSYSDLRTHTLSKKYSLNDEEKSLYERCVIFLESDEEYSWPEYQGFTIEGLGWPLLILTLGLLFPLDILIRRRNRQARILMSNAGDIEVWPFLRRNRYEEFRSRRGVPI